MTISLTENLLLIPITIQDTKTLAELMGRIYPPAYQYLWHDDCSWYLNKLYNQSSIIEDIEEADGDFYFVRYKDENQGILKLQYKTPFPEMPNKGALRLHRIYLSEEVQGNGISHALMAYVENKAKELNVDLIWLDCMESKDQALKYYRKYGFHTGTLSSLDFELLIDKYRGIFLMWKEIKTNDNSD